MKPECELFAGRLIEGEPPASDPALAEHVGSCLSCFRLQAELQDVPRIVEALRAEPVPDPGEAFWRSFSARVWERRYDASPEATLARRPGSIFDTWFSLVFSWLRRPLPAALAGAVAVAVIFFGLRLVSSSRTGSQRPPIPEIVASESEAPSSDSLFVPTDVSDLDEPALQALLAKISNADKEIDSFVEEVEDEGAALSPVQRVQTLDAETLRVLDRNLQKLI